MLISDFPQKMQVFVQVNPPNFQQKKTTSTPLQKKLRVDTIQNKMSAVDNVVYVLDTVADRVRFVYTELDWSAFAEGVVYVSLLPQPLLLPHLMLFYTQHMNTFFTVRSLRFCTSASSTWW